MTAFAYHPMVFPGPPVDPRDIGPVCTVCGGRSIKAQGPRCDCGGYGYLSSPNAVARCSAIFGTTLNVNGAA